VAKGGEEEQKRSKKGRGMIEKKLNRKIWGFRRRKYKGR
jgi:hypothetical protein